MDRHFVKLSLKFSLKYQIFAAQYWNLKQKSPDYGISYKRIDNPNFILNSALSKETYCHVILAFCND